ncbi:uncharacterized protein CANTADRAFT_229170 [Suhomyces tanzawaensis NRRL Y-17324]|uniref:Uncharacterized protein n=1 Tax=Suhomyces tanzawaensis NRRL Y-17324 TaxID=984487 RepID=A0A1E4SKX8_9ASCO|nr:uncharacterized protein CANTADRAFT_229170 [Suhomyces tanzawaensis NRRL Y-17324]ODV80156.1 hypothetical protein CANTADRAFT_229170 [Suhomyces tanzawaensis NRRL Y-17324]
MLLYSLLEITQDDYSLKHASIHYQFSYYHYLYKRRITTRWQWERCTLRSQFFQLVFSR